MKIRKDFVTNSSSSSFTVMNFNSSIIDGYLKKYPVIFTNDFDSDKQEDFTSINDLLETIANIIDENGEAEFLEDKGIIDNIIYILDSEEYEDRNESVSKFIRFLKKNKKEIEAEGEGEILYASQFEADLPTIEAFINHNGKTRHIYIDLNDVELDEDEYDDILDLSESSPEIIHDVLKRYASCNGIKFVVTGKLNSFENRDELVEYIESKGGVVSSSVTAKTDYLINNDNTSTSTKNKKANELGVSVITETQFLEMFGDNKDNIEPSDFEISENMDEDVSTEDISAIRVYLDDDPELGATIVAEMVFENNGSKIYLLEYCYTEVPNVVFLVTTESVWFYYTNKKNTPKDDKKLKQILTKNVIEQIDEICAEVIEYNGSYKQPLMLLHNAILKEAEKSNIDVGFEWEFE